MVDSSSLPLAVTTRISTVEVEMLLVQIRPQNIISSIGQEFLNIRSTMFEFIYQTVACVGVELPSNAYYLFIYPHSLLYCISLSNISTNDSFGGEYRSSRTKFANTRADHHTASFNRDFLLVFGNVETTTSGGSLLLLILFLSLRCTLHLMQMIINQVLNRES